MPCISKTTLDWHISRKFEKQVKSNFQNCFTAVDPRVIFQTRKDSAFNLQGCCAHQSSKYGRTSIRVPL